MTTLDNDTAKALASPFDDGDVKWKPQVTTKGKSKEPIMRNGQRIAGCTAHIDARAVMNRLDEVVGPGNWSDSYQVILNGANVECTLTVCGVSKSDVGEPNKDGFADAMKAAYSDALKRAAVKFGIGRYLYDMDMEWLLFDGYKILDQPKGTQKAAKSKPAKKETALNVPERISPDEVKRTGVDDHAQHIDVEPSDYLEAAVSSANLKNFAENIVAAGVGYTEVPHVVTALTKTYSDEMNEKFMYPDKDPNKRRALVNWLVDRKADGAA